MFKRLMNVFDLRSMLPRERRRISHRETYKGVTGDVAGKPRTEAVERKRAERRARRTAMTNAIVAGLRENPAGAKRMRRYAKVAGYLVQDHDERGKEFLRRPTAFEAEAWYHRREEAPHKFGHQRSDPFVAIEMWTWLGARSAQPATPVMGTK